MKKTKFSEFIKILDILEKEGFDVRSLTKTKRNENGKYVYASLKDITQGELNIEDVIAKHNLKGDYPFGRMKLALDRACRGSNLYTITDEEKQKGIKYVAERSTDKLFNIVEILSSEGVDISKIKLNKMRDGKQVSTVLTDIKQKNIDMNKIIEKHHLNPNYNIGTEITVLRQAYNGNRMYRVVTDEDRIRAEKLGIVNPEKVSTLTSAINVLTILQAEGVDINNINSRKNDNYTLLSDIKQKDINIEDIIKRNHLDANYEIGRHINALKKARSGKTTYAITDDQIRQIEELFDEKNSKGVGKLLEILEILKLEGVDINAIKGRKENASSTIADIKQDGIDINSIIEKYQLDGDYKIGSQINTAKRMYRGKEKKQRAMTKEERARAEKLGIFDRKSSKAEELLDILDILASENVDISGIHQTKKDSTGKEMSTTLMDIRHGNIKEIIERNNLEPNYPIGMKITKFRQSYKGKGGYRVTAEDKRRGEELGIVEIADLEIEQRKLRYQLEKAKELEKSVESAMER